MTNLFAIIVLTLATNVSSVEIQEGSWVSGPGSGQTPDARAYPPDPRRLVREETTVIIETASVAFEYEGRPYTLPFHNRTVSRTVRRFRPKLVEEEVK